MYPDAGLPPYPPFPCEVHLDKNAVSNACKKFLNRFLAMRLGVSVCLHNQAFVIIGFASPERQSYGLLVDVNRALGCVFDGA
jgi:hypothetical protein